MLICRKYVGKGELLLRRGENNSQGRTVDVINLEPLSMVEPKGQGVMKLPKRRTEFSAPVGMKLMADAMRGTRTLRRLAGLQAQRYRRR